MERADGIGRRSLLAAAGSGVLAGVAGCFGIFESGCGPGDTELDEIEKDVQSGSASKTVNVEASVMGHLDESKLLVTDDTGKARLSVREDQIDSEDEVGKGTCVAGPVEVNVKRTEWLEMPVVAVPDGETLSVTGDSERAVQPPPDAPDGFETESTDGGVRVRFLDDEGPMAKKLLVKQRTGDGVRRSYWHEMDDGITEDERVGKNQSIVVEGSGKGALFWDRQDDWKPVIVSWKL